MFRFFLIFGLFLFQIVFSDAWWIGRKEENPEEARLEFPKELNVVSFFCRVIPNSTV